MKFSPTLTLAVALAAGLAGTAAAQTTATPSANTSPAAGNSAAWNPAHPGSSYATQPQAGSSQTPTAGTRQQGANWKQQQGVNAQQGAQAAPMQQPAAPGQSAASNPPVQQAQEQLKAAGLYNGPTDGLMDPDTRAAIAKFQQQHGLRRTERLDPQTMSALGSAQTSGFGSAGPGATMPAEGATPAPTGAGGNNNNANKNAGNAGTSATPGANPTPGATGNPRHPYR